MWLVTRCRIGKRTATEEAHKALARILAMGFIDPSLLETDDTDNVTCSICMQLLDTPMSPGGCQEGHTFCASCLRDALKATPRCPTCRAASTPDALTRNRFAENVINELRMRCAHGAAPPSAEPDAKRQKKEDDVLEHQKGAVVTSMSTCSWSGKVADYRAHLAEHCLFEPHSCKECGAMVAKRDDARHAVVCTVTCPFFGCGHKCPRAQMAQHHVDAADAHARAATAEISALKESSAAATRQIKELEVRVEDLNQQSQWTVVNVDFRLPAALCFTVPPTGVDGAYSPWFPVWGGLNLRFRWLSYAPDARGIHGMAPNHCYLLMTDLTTEACDGVEMYGKLAVHGSGWYWTVASRANPVGFSGTERNGHYVSSSVSFTDGAADLQLRSQMTKSDGMVRFMGRYWFRDPWRQSYLRRDD